MFPTDVSFEMQDQEALDGGGVTIQFKKNAGFLLSDGIVRTNGGIDAVNQWIELLLETRPGQYPVYSETGFGVDSRQLVNKRKLPDGFVRSEFERQVKEQIQLNPYISHADQFEYTRKGAALEVVFCVHMKNGENLEVKKLV